jgi:hypothetical protein
VAKEVTELTRESLVRAEGIRKPNLVLRTGLGVLLLLAGWGIFQYVQHREDINSMESLMRFLDVSKTGVAYLVAAAIFLVTLEARLKRRRALTAVHELRAMAHIIDMHQLTKDPDRLGAQGPIMVAGEALTADSMARYLDYCTEMLALLGKIGQLYVQQFPDATALAAVDHFQNQITGLSGKIWQKIMILDVLPTEKKEQQPTE